MHAANERAAFWFREASRLAARDGWSIFGSRIDRNCELEFDGVDPEDGLPLWEREVRHEEG